ncbi:MAG: hypothetical protein GAK41_00485 [Burkholderia gladioli]|nr:MAG: hypothetical protein GAK41_00485 [Burkholderia gladioli]
MTVATVCVKFWITGAHLQSMIEGVLAGINYAASFTLMHFLHFTLAAKQPAMTAPTLARELDDIGHEEGVRRFVVSVVALIRTQAAAISGNVLAVLPVCLAVQLGAHAWLHADVISVEKAHATLRSFSLLGPTPFYAGLTGVLHRVGDAIAWHRRLRLTLGVAGAARLARFCRTNVAGVIGNVGLGMMLGLVPAIVSAFAFGFEVRHVTLSAGSIGVAVGVIGERALGSGELWWAIAGVLSMAVLNVAVSFALAFTMAVRSRALRPTKVRALIAAIWRAVRANPASLIWPQAASGQDGHAPGSRSH